MDISTLSIADLTALAVERRAFAASIATKDGVTLAEVGEAEAALVTASEADARIAELQGQEPASADAVAALRAALAPEEEAATEETEEAAEEVVAETEEVEEAATQEVAPVVPGPAVPASPLATLAGKVARPAAPAATRKSPISITAAADVPDFGAGQPLGDIATVAEALVSRTKAFGSPSGTVDQYVRDSDGNAIGVNPGYTPDLRFAGVAKFGLEFPEDLRIDRGSDDLSIIKHATDEKRLKSDKGAGSLTAAGGWCTPSENLYDLCEGETLDGLISVPEIQVRRGGINFTKGPDWATLYADPDLGFIQTEAQAEAGTAKPCYEIECPDWTDVRLDAVGLCIRVPILTNAAFPELTQRVVRGALVAHQHKVNASVISRMVTIAGPATTAIDYTTTAHNLWENLERIANIKRQHYKLGLDESMEVILPYWVKSALRNDLALRGGRPLDAVTDAYIMSEFAVRRLAPQFVYDWQELDADTVTAGYPNTVNVLMYPAGTFVKGVADVINLNAVYDAASLATNVFTGLFFEEGLLVANTCFDADLVTIPVCGSGHTGAQDVSVCGVDTTP